MNRVAVLILITVGLMLCPVPSSAAATAIVTVKNPLEAARTSETIVLDASELRKLLSIDDVRRIHVNDQKSGKELLTQAIDTNDDGAFDQFIFQIDIGPLETQKFALTVGDRQVATRDQYKAYGRFVRERRDDFAWENDRIAHRMYGAALETWAQEPLTSSSVDVWTKRTRRLVINDWYMVDDYHRDHGEGADLYSAGNSRGCGGNGIWFDGKLFPSANFRDSRVLANGPIRVMFELTYPAWQAGNARVSEVKRITLDAGQNFDLFESHYTISGNSKDLSDAIGIRKAPGSQSAFSRERGTLRTWESFKGDDGQLGCAVIVDTAIITNSADDAKNFLVIADTADNTITYYAGFGWSKSGDFNTIEDWDRYVSHFAARVRAPLQVTLAAR